MRTAVTTASTSTTTSSPYSASTSAKKNATYLERYRHFTPDNFGHQPGSEELCARLKDASICLAEYESDREILCKQFTDSVTGLTKILVTENWQQTALIILLAVMNCHSKESINKLQTKLDRVDNDDEASNYLKKQANKDNNLEVPAPTDRNPQAVQPFSAFRQNLLQSFIEFEFSDSKGMNEERRQAVSEGLTRAKSQLEAGIRFDNRQ